MASEMKTARGVIISELCNAKKWRELSFELHFICGGRHARWQHRLDAYCSRGLCLYAYVGVSVLCKGKKTHSYISTIHWAVVLPVKFAPTYNDYFLFPFRVFHYNLWLFNTWLIVLFLCKSVVLFALMRCVLATISSVHNLDGPVDVFCQEHSSNSATTNANYAHRLRRQGNNVFVSLCKLLDIYHSYHLGTPAVPGRCWR